ncbi:MAG: hypothetical protein OXE99_09970 [Cellvibrionales bacterium]|nr:hypothetical protein [Cellvibrionales bacterium]
MAYTHFQYIAYQTPTFGRNNVNDTWMSALSAGDMCDEIQGVTFQDNGNLSEDAKKRLRRLAAVVNKAQSELVGDQDTTLKVFVAPEFYFRPEASTNHHSYSTEEQQHLIAALANMFTDAKFDHWVIVAGTVIANLVKMPLTTPKIYNYYNTAIVIRGGAQGFVNAIEKQQPSSIDGVPVDGGISNPFVKTNNYKQYYSQWGVRKKRIFDVDGIRMGLDICLDHAGPVAFNPKGAVMVQDILRVTKRLTNEYLARPPFPAPLKELSLHILTAGGMSIQKHSVAAKNGGYILRTDGHPGMPSTVEFKRVTGYSSPAGTKTFYDLYTGAPNPAPALTKSSSTFPNCPEANMVNIAATNTSALTGKLKIPIPADYNPTNMSQNILTFPVTAMP